MRLIPSSLSLVSVCFGFLCVGCPSGGVGDPCTPEDEYSPTFAGFDEGETNAETRSFQCETRVCLVNHFRGRVSCPYGNTDATGGGTCYLPGSKDQVTPNTVRPQLLERRPEDAVYCSCRCAGPDSNARYCECPSGFECAEIIPNFEELGVGERAGSYCIRQGTKVDDPSTIVQTSCSAAAHNCGK